MNLSMVDDAMMAFAHKVKDECFALARSENPDLSEVELGIIAGKLARAKYNEYLQSKPTEGV